MNTEYKYVWESRRGLYRVVIDTPVYSKQTKRTTHHYETVGKAYEKDGPIEFGAKFMAVQKAQSDVVSAKSVTLVGEKLVLDKMSATTNLLKTLVRSFGKDKADMIFNLACYLICTGDALSNSSTWQEERGLKVLSAPRISELLPDLSEENCSGFFKNWTSLHARNRTLCYDITSVSTYARDMAMAIPAPRPCAALRRMTALSPNSSMKPHSPIASDVTVNSEMPVTNTLLYPTLLPSFDQRRMKQLSIRV